ncbi:S-Ena type endospore appendage [Defluviitalea saccharophila]|uniref:Endospore appendages core domain-containing protein n=1 Tax=Defluviitalea saccharophila TaxID=879970 RepID=A0ABZ2Y3S3_9FIRM
MSLQVLMRSTKSCCPTPLECVDNFFIKESGTVWESYVPIKGTFNFYSYTTQSPVTIKIYLFDGKTVSRNLEPGQSFVFTGDNIRKIQAFVSNAPANLFFEYCIQTLTEVDCKRPNQCCPESLQCEFQTVYRNIPMNKNYLLWQSTIPMTGSFRIDPLSLMPTEEFEFKVIIKRFNQPALIETISRPSVIRSSGMQSLLVNMPTLEEPPVLSVDFCLRDDVSQ